MTDRPVVNTLYRGNYVVGPLGSVFGEARRYYRLAYLLQTDAAYNFPSSMVKLVNTDVINVLDNASGTLISKEPVKKIKVQRKRSVKRKKPSLDMTEVF